MHAMRPFGRTLAALAVAATTTLAACSGDSTGPRTVASIDADLAASKVAPIAAVFEQSAFESMVFAGDFFAPAAGSSLASVSRLTATMRSGRTADASAILLARSAAAVVSAEVLPAEIRGSTYVFDPSLGAYVEDDAATGAPANGLRIVLYAWDALAGEPALPLTRIGYVDLIDQSTSSSDALRVRVVRDQGSAALADYVISQSASATSASFGINGTATNGTTTVNFALNGSATANRVTASFNVSVPSLGYSVGMQTSVDLALERATANLSIGYDGHTLTFNQTATENSAQGEVRYDGALYARYEASYNPNTGVVTESFVKANGEPLTQQELAQLVDLFERAFDLGGFWEGLLWPAYAFEQGV